MKKRVEEQTLPPLTLANIKRHSAFKAALEDRVFAVARRYFRKKHGSLWDPEKLTISGEIRSYADSKVSVQAYEDRHLEDTVEIPLSLVVDRDWEKKVDAWTANEKEREALRRKFRELRHVQEMMKKYPAEVAQIASGKELEL